MAEEAVIKRIMPNSIEAEQAVIGSMLIDQESISIASEIVTPDDFYNRQYGIIYEAMLELNNENKQVDIVTLQNKLKEKDVPEDLCSLDYMRDIVAAVPTSTHIRYYAGIVAEKSTLRKLIKASDEIENNCYEGKESMDYILDDAEKKIFDMVQRRSFDDFVPIDKVVLSAVERIEAAYRSGGTVTGIPTGFIDLDFMTSGLQPADLILIAARPSMGKTAFALNIAQHMAFKQNKSVAIFSLEMSKEQLINRLFALEGNIEATHLRNGKLDESEWDKLAEAASIIGDSGLIIDDTPGISVSALRSKCRKYKLEKGLDCIFIDYLQLMTGSGRIESRQQEISEISRSLKGLARELNVPVVALSQLSREVEKRPDKRPMMSDLRESGAIEQDADVIMFIYRDDYYHEDTERKNISDIIIGKQRNGPVGTVELAWIPQYTKFGNIEKRRRDISSE
ncbi:MAG: replicative DNA helicase [Lachnospiraceae bacterium]|nr:replicative DNA helicase [Lachnospiraceae bacterium]